MHERVHDSNDELVIEPALPLTPLTHMMFLNAADDVVRDWAARRNEGQGADPVADMLLGKPVNRKKDWRYS